MTKHCIECGRERRPRLGGRGYCGACYQRHRKTGEFSARALVPIKTRILRRVRIDDNGCWLWTGYVDSPRTGYASLSIHGHRVLAHRAAFEAFVGPIPDGLQIDHLCRVRHCVNPTHLEPVTSRENTMRSPITVAARHAAKTHCPQGHPYSPENTYQYANGRHCRTCVLDRSRARAVSA